MRQLPGRSGSTGEQSLNCRGDFAWRQKSRRTDFVSVKGISEAVDEI